MAKQAKFYVVWKGFKSGVFDTWAECQAQISGFSNAKFKAFSTREAALEALDQDYERFEGQDTKTHRMGPAELTQQGVILDSVCVDAACSGNPGDLEYRGVDTESSVQLFHQGPFPEGTVNVGEFLAIVHALSVLVRKGRNCPIYSDSRTALSWVRDKRVNTKLRPSAANRPLFELLARAQNWLANHTYPNPLLKWETEQWGENPADFGRK
jgi:ribonuclease HI